ncbi:hypothetical protein KAX75_03915 [candidate division WOR-3 bacterium]|nr:hypothetical protein [candidate division WOR-3 bacterium]
MKYVTSISALLVLCVFLSCTGPTKPLNQPPNQASALYPVSGEVDIFVEIALYWSGSDPEGDPVTYDLYFGVTSPPPILESNMTEAHRDPGVLQYGATYYWKVDAKDNQGNTTEGNIWQFETVAYSDYYLKHYLATGTYISIDGNYHDPDPDRDAPWIALSSYGTEGAGTNWEFFGFSKTDIETLIIGTYSYDDGWDITGGEHYRLFNHETQDWDIIFDSDKQEGWHYAQITGTAAKPYVHASTNEVILRLKAGYTDHSHIREVFCKQADLDTSLSSGSGSGTITIIGGMETDR